MARSLAAVAFIGGVAAAGIFVATRPTVMDGRVLAADRLSEARDRGDPVVAVECDREVPVHDHGATFECTLQLADGASARVRYAMDRAGALSSEILDSSPPAR